MVQWASHFQAPARVAAAPRAVQSLLLCLGKQQRTVQALGSRPPLWETWVEFQPISALAVAAIRCG